ncbi:MAG: hypothetical protein QGF59_03025, partial [Pirellulaceae bacterium]|nr:hypothetical protein [Pirellulaceae bacterium]
MILRIRVRNRDVIKLVAIEVGDANAVGRRVWITEKELLELLPVTSVEVNRIATLHIGSDQV